MAAGGFVSARKKTETEATLPVSDEALAYCGPRGTGIVFKGLVRSMVQHPLQKWLRQAGITKHIAFHSRRHTFATTLCLSQGIPLSTVSKMLGHKQITTTLIYAQTTPIMIENAIDRVESRLDGKFAT